MYSFIIKRVIWGLLNQPLSLLLFLLITRVQSRLCLLFSLGWNWERIPLWWVEYSPAQMKTLEAKRPHGWVNSTVRESGNIPIKAHGNTTMSQGAVV